MSARFKTLSACGEDVSALDEFHSSWRDFPSARDGFHASWREFLSARDEFYASRRRFLSSAGGSGAATAAGGEFRAETWVLSGGRA
jgi:hypothetical protein